MPHMSGGLVTKFNIRGIRWRLALGWSPHALIFVLWKVFLLKNVVCAFNLMLFEQLNELMHVFNHILIVPFSFSGIHWLPTLRQDVVLLVELYFCNFANWRPEIIPILLLIKVIKEWLESQWYIVSFLFRGVILMFLILCADSFISDLSHYFPKFH